jgi:hypothetical protein
MGIFNADLLQMVIKWGPKQVKRMAESISLELSVTAALSIPHGQFEKILEHGRRRQNEANAPDIYLNNGTILRASVMCLLILGSSRAAKLAICKQRQLNAARTDEIRARKHNLSSVGL